MVLLSLLGDPKALTFNLAVVGHHFKHSEVLHVSRLLFVCSKKLGEELMMSDFFYRLHLQLRFATG